MELCVAKYWSSLDTAEINYHITFHGVISNYRNAKITMHGGEGIMRLDLTSNLANEKVDPSIILKNLVKTYRYLELNRNSYVLTFFSG